VEPIADVTNTDPIDDSIGLGFEMDLATEADEALDEIEADDQYETEVDTDLEDEKFADDAVEVTTEDELEDAVVLLDLAIADRRVFGGTHRPDSWNRAIGDLRPRQSGDWKRQNRRNRLAFTPRKGRRAAAAGTSPSQFPHASLAGRTTARNRIVWVAIFLKGQSHFRCGLNHRLQRVSTYETCLLATTACP